MPGVPLLLALRLEDRDVLVVGGGDVAVGRVRTMLPTGARLRVVAPEVDEAIIAAGVPVTLRTWEPADLDGAAFVCCAVDDPDVSARVAAACRARGVLVNVADRPELCDAYFPAVHRQGELQVAVSTGGVAPGLAAVLRDWLAARLPADAPEGLARFAALRRAIRAVDPTPAGTRRRMAWLRDYASRRDLSALARLGDDEIAALAAAFRDGRAI